MVDACDKLKAENATLVQKQGSSETAVAQVPQQQIFRLLMQALERAKKLIACYELEFEQLKEERAEFEASKQKATAEESKSAEPEQTVGMKRKRV